jgi:LacI family transcriptional regulator
MLPAGRAYTRGIALGIIKYAHVHDHWNFFVHGGMPVTTIDQLTDWDGEGIIAFVASREELAILQSKNIPVVNVANILKHIELASVIPDDFAIGRLGAEHFLERGFTQFAFYGGVDEAWCHERRRGFEETVLNAGFTCSVYSSGTVPAQDETALTQWLTRLPKPVGLMTWRDMQGRLIIEQCKNCKIIVPDDVAVLGVNNSELLTALPYPPLSSVKPAAERIGREAAHLLGTLMAGKQPIVNPKRIEPEGIVTRRSTDVFPVDDPEVAGALRFIRDHATESIWIPDILSEVNLPRRTLERRFRMAVGRSLTQEITRVRIARVKRYLCETSMTISRIAQVSGFTSVEQLHRVFRKNTGFSPGEFRTHFYGK